MKMEKTPRYTQRERNMVLGFAAQYKDVIENKRTDAESNRKKDEVWRQIAKEFNLRVYHQRSSKQLRQLYKNMKLLLKKDLCGEGKGNRSFMDLLNTLSQQESVAQYISEQMSPSGYSSSRQQKYDDEYDDSKLPSVSFDGMDTDVIVIKSEDISDNEQSQNGMDDDDDDDCLSPKDIPEVCLEEEDDEIFATDLRQPPLTQQQQQQQQLQNQRQNQHLQLSAQHQQTQQQQQQQQPEITIQNIGGIRVGSIGSLANLKALQNGNNSALSITHANGNSSSSNNNSASNNNSSGSSSSNNNHNNIANTSNSSSNNRQITAEQQAQHLLLNGLGLSAVHPPEPPLPTLHRGGGGGGGGVHSSNSHTNHHHHHLSNSTNQLLMNLNAANSYGHSKMKFGMMGNNHNGNHNNNINNNNNNNNNLMNNQNNDYLISLAIEERKLKIDLIKAQIEYWKKMTKNLDSNGGYNPTPACPCHFPGKVNGLQTPTSSS